MNRAIPVTVAAFAISIFCMPASFASTVDLKAADFALPQSGVSMTAPALYEGLAKTTPPDLSEFASRQPKLRNESLPQDLRNREVKREEKRAN